MKSVQNHAFSTILWLRCDEMHFENRQQYSAPAGALTFVAPETDMIFGDGVGASLVRGVMKYS